MATHNEGGDVPVLSATNAAAAAPIAGVKLAEQPVAPPVDDITKPVANGLQDQTAFLPAKQVVAVYMGLSLALLCSFLDQTIFVNADAGTNAHQKKHVDRCFVNFLDHFPCLRTCKKHASVLFRVLIIVSDIVSLADRGKYMGITEGVIAIANGCGPLLAIAVTIWLLPLKGVRGSFREKFFKVDYLGSVLTILFSVLVLQREPLPIVPVNIFLYPTVVGVYINTMCSAGTFFGLMFFIPQYLQLVRGNSSVRASALTLPLLVPVAFFVVASGQIVSRTGHYRWLIIFGHACWCIGQGLQSTMDLHTSTGKIVGVLLMSGISAGFTFQTYGYKQLKIERLLGLSEETIDTLLDNPTVINQVEFKAMLSTSQRFGILNSYMKGFTTVFYVTVGLQAIATASSVLLIKHHELRRPDDEAMKQQGRDLVRNKQLGQDDEQDLEKAAISRTLRRLVTTIENYKVRGCHRSR
ncbi:MFS general substrate transporter [Auriculariales sp. MPI-PUGE-AT-0066]|nr:MFS general substrate transporter [Auriculariales sp. MPI-PUGE-AT-0066]